MANPDMPNFKTSKGNCPGADSLRPTDPAPVAQLTTYTITPDQGRVVFTCPKIITTPGKTEGTCRLINS